MFFEWAISLLLSVFALVATATQQKFFQLAGYRVEKGFLTYFKTGVFFACLLCGLVSGIIGLLLGEFWWAAQLGFWFVACVYQFSLNKQKAKLTPRLVRLRVVFVIASTVMTYFLQSFAMIAICMFCLLLSGILTRPFEWLVAIGFERKAKKKLSECGAKVIAITGSFGKTSTKHILTEILRSTFCVVASPQNFNTPMGLCKFVNGTNLTGVDFVVLEFGARYKGDIQKLTKVFPPHYGILTGVGDQHLETFKTFQRLLAEKWQLVNGCSGEVFVANQAQLQEHQKLVQAPNVVMLEEGCFEEGSFVSLGTKTTFAMRIEGKSTRLTTSLLGRHNISNIALCVALASKLGVKEASIKQAVERLKSFPHRLSILETNGVVILDDSYNANLQGVKNSFEVLRSFAARKIVVIAGIVEGGKKQQSMNEEVGKELAKSCDRAILVGLNGKAILRGLVEGGFDTSNAVLVPTLQEAKGQIKAQRGDVVLFSNDLPENIF